MKLIDLTGKKSGYLTVLSKSKNQTNAGQPKWVCRCCCGELIEAPGPALRRQSIKSCGCMKSDLIRAASTKWIVRPKQVYTAWNTMRARCYDANNHAYKRYGGRGIRVCPSWLASFDAFLRDMGEPPTDDHSIDRIDNDGNYSPENCRWATRKQQARNRRSSRIVTAFGESKPLAAWAEDARCKVKYGTLKRRLRIGLEPEDAITRALQPGARMR